MASASWGILFPETRARPYDASELKLGRCCQGPLGACREFLKGSRTDAMVRCPVTDSLVRLIEALPAVLQGNRS